MSEHWTKQSTAVYTEASIQYPSDAKVYTRPLQNSTVLQVYSTFTISNRLGCTLGAGTAIVYSDQELHHTKHARLYTWSARNQETVMYTEPDILFLAVPSKH